MNFYLSDNNRRIIKKNYKYLLTSNSVIIDINSIKKRIKYKDTVYYDFILTEDVKKMFLSYYKSKKINNIVYLVNKIDLDVIVSLKEFLDVHNIFYNLILIDFLSSTDESLFTEFDNII